MKPALRVRHRTMAKTANNKRHKAEKSLKEKMELRRPDLRFFASVRPGGYGTSGRWFCN